MEFKWCCDPIVVIFFEMIFFFISKKFTSVGSVNTCNFFDIFEKIYKCWIECKLSKCWISPNFLSPNGQGSNGFLDKCKLNHSRIKVKQNCSPFLCHFLQPEKNMRGLRKLLSAKRSIIDIMYRLTNDHTYHHYLCLD